jgi:hypothetical protein
MPAVIVSSVENKEKPEPEAQIELYARAMANKAVLLLETDQWLTLTLSPSLALNLVLSRRLVCTKHNLQLGNPSPQQEAHFIGMVPANAGQHRTLFDLPDVVLRRVMEELAEEDHLSTGRMEAEDMALSQFRLTCREALHLAEPARWKYIDLSWDSRAERINLRPDRIKSSLDADERRLKWVQNLNVSCTSRSNVRLEDQIPVQQDIL